MTRVAVEYCRRGFMSGQFMSTTAMVDDSELARYLQSVLASSRAPVLVTGVTVVEGDGDADIAQDDDVEANR